MFHSKSRIAAFVLIILFTAIMIFQILMALGLHLKGATWGTQLDSNPVTLRIASFVACLILLFMILTILEKLGKIKFIRKQRVINVILWIFGAYLLLNAVGNFFSPGAIERLAMTPLALICAVLCMIVARAKV